MCRFTRSAAVMARLLGFLLIIKLAEAEYRNIEGLANTVYKLDGDINIGGVFPLHRSGVNGSFCGGLRELGVLQRAEAMAFYINEINKSDKLLPNITLGFTILDDCYKETTALAQGLKFIPTTTRSDNETTGVARNKKDEFVAVIGAESSTNSKQLAELFRLFKIPQISYLSTSPSLGNKVAYPYFTRIVPSDKHQVTAIVDLLNHFNWSYVSFVYSISFYGLEAYLLLLEKVRGNSTNICLAVEAGLPEDPTGADYENVVKSLMMGSNGVPSHVVVLFVSQTVAMEVLKTAQRLGQKGMFSWIASDAWGRNVQDFHGVEGIAEGVLTIKISSSNDPEFDKYFSKLNDNISTNPFLTEFWIAACSRSSVGCGRGTTFANLPDVYQPESTVSLVKIAVSLLANGLHELLGQCRVAKGDGSNCTGEEFRESITSDELQQMLWGLKGCVDSSTCVDIDMRGEGQTQYSIMNLQKSKLGAYDLKKIGYYNTKHKIFNITEKTEDIYWNSAITKKENSIPVSVCSSTCHWGQKQKQMGFENTKCCWECEDCKSNEFTEVHEINGLETFQCEVCEAKEMPKMKIFTYPTKGRDQCQPIVPKSIDIYDPFAIAIVVLDIICFFATVLLLVHYIRNKEHRLIKATSLELSYIIWSGLFFSYISIIWYFLPLQFGCDSVNKCEPTPNTHWCYLQFITFSLSFTVINAPMLTRVNRIYRIFTKGKKSAAKPRFIENRYQLMIVAALVSIQVIIIIICCLLSHYAVVEDIINITNYQDDKDSSKSYISCEIPYSLLLPPVIYNLLLGIASACHAFKTRKLPDNFNESRFIGMTVYTTVIMWVAFIPAYVSINSQYYKGVPLSIALLINSIITTSCLFVPRLYALRWVEGGRMNLRSLSVSLHSIGDKSRRSSIPDAKAIRNGSASNENIYSVTAPRGNDVGFNKPISNGRDVSTTATHLSNGDSGSYAFQELSSTCSSADHQLEVDLSSSA